MTSSTGSPVASGATGGSGGSVGSGGSGGSAPFASWLGDTNDITKAFLAAGQIPGLINIAGGLPDPSLYPAAEIEALAARAVRLHPQETLGYGPLDGLPDLRRVIAARFSTPHVRLELENVLVTTSGMQALDLLGKVLLDPGDVIAGQFPTYLGALDAWRPREPHFRPLHLDGPNPDLDPDFDFHTAMRGAKFAYTVPNFSNPTGKLVPLATRQALLKAAQETGTWLVEDDPYGGLSYDGPLPPSLLSLSATAATEAAATAAADASPAPYSGPVVYLGTLSKLVVPGLRIGWVIAAPAMIEALTLAKQGSDMCTSGLTQRMACEILKDGLIEALNPAMLRLYRERREALCQALEQDLSPWFEWQRPEGGMFVWLRAKDPALDTDRLFKLGLEELVCVSPSSVFDASGAFRHGLRLNFTFNDPDKLREAVKRLARATQRLLAEEP